MSAKTQIIVERVRKRYSERQLYLLAKSWGISYDKNGKIKVNANVFLEKYLNTFLTVITKSGTYYQYLKKQGIWVAKDTRDVKRHLRNILQFLAPDEWNNKINTDISTTLPLACDDFEKLASPTRYINLKNGLLDLETFKLRRHTPCIASLTQLPFDYAPEAQCPKFKQFLQEVFRGDKELISRAQEIMGYCLSPSTQAQTFFILYSDGSSGKSVFCSILRELAGGDSNVSSVTLSNLGNKFQRAELYGKILNISTENEASKFNTEALKSITSGDQIQVEHKFQNPFTARITAKLLFAMNSLPEPQDKTFAFYRRLIFLPFLTRFVDNPQEGTNELQRKPNIEEELLEELQGILAWSIRGLMRLVQNKYQFTPSKEADKLMLEYRKDISPVFGFIEDCIEKDTGNSLSTQILFNAYNSWCVENGIHDRIAKKPFLKALREGLTKSNIPFNEYHSGLIRGFRDIHLLHNTRRISDDDIFDDEDDFAEDNRHYVVEDYEDDNEVA